MLIASAGELAPQVASTSSAVDAICDEVLQLLCQCLPGRDLLRLSVAAKPLNRLTSDSKGIWRFLCTALLGDPICHLHTAVAEQKKQTVDTRFWQKMFRHGRELRLARWSPSVRTVFLQSLSVTDEEERKEKVQAATIGSGHCTVGMGHLVVKVGGLRPQCTLDHLHTVVFDLRELAIRELELVPDSERPERRLRHAACEIRPELTSRQPSVLVLGGCHDRTKQPCKGGLQLLHILEILTENGSLGKWQSIPATGQAPGAIWHHVCGSFALGQKVVVFGGDFNSQDPEFQGIADRSLPAGFVYVLDVNRLVWERVVTSGRAPTWRSLHAGFTHRDISSHSERLVILGGCAENLPIFSSSDNLAPMHGHALDLRKFEWLPQPDEAPNLPTARLRLASEKVGEWLLLYGGHGERQEIGERVQLHKLNLRTLRWSTFDVQGREASFPAAPAATLTAGLVLGGVRFRPFGISPVPKIDVLLLGDIGAEEDDQNMEQTQQAEDDDSDSDDGIIGVIIRDSSGNNRRVVLPRAMLALLAGRMQDVDDEDEDDNDEDMEENTT